MTHDLIKFNYDQLDAESRIIVRQEDKEFDQNMNEAGKNFLRACHNVQRINHALKYKRPGFTNWLESKPGMSISTAYKMLNVAQMFPDSGNIIDASKEALYLLAAPSTPDEARQEILETAEKGRTITYTQAKETVDFHRPNPLQNRVNKLDQPAEPIDQPHLHHIVQTYTQTYVDHLGRTFSDLIGNNISSGAGTNPSHTNSVFFNDLSSYLDNQSIPYNDAVLKHIIKNIAANLNSPPPETNSLQQAKADLVNECVRKWRAWIKKQPLDPIHYLDSIYRYAPEWDPDSLYNSSILRRAEEILRQEYSTKIDDHPVYAPISKLESMFNAWLIYATGERSKTDHYTWMRTLKGQGKNGENFTDTCNWFETRILFRKNDLWQAAMNITDQLRQQLLNQKAPESLDSPAPEEEGTSPAPSSPEYISQLSTILSIQRQLKGLVISLRKKDDHELIFSLTQALTQLDVALDILKGN